jgi:hypothetical protein
MMSVSPHGRRVIAVVVVLFWLLALWLKFS